MKEQIPVGTVCAMFGLNPNTIRTWERRYHFPSPGRSEKGHRSYTENDIRLIAEIVDLMKSGMGPAAAITQVMEAASVSVPELDSPVQSEYQSEVFRALEEHDHGKLDNLTREVVTALGYTAFIETCAFPLLSLLGSNWEQRGHGVAAEHAYTRVVANVIAEKAQSLRPAEDAPIVTFACVPFELHQLPLLHLANLAVEQEVARPIILTAGLPMDEIIDASRRGSANAIVLSATIVPSASDTRQWVARCVNAGWGNRLLLAGPGFVRSRVYAEYPVRAGAGNFEQTLEVLRSVLAK